MVASFSVCKRLRTKNAKYSKLKRRYSSRQIRLKTSHLLISRKHESQRRADWNVLEEKE
jgi:hypothetical protein